MSIFSTRTDQAFNTFQTAQPTTMQQAGWGVDPNYLTPSFDAPYRPQYNGDQGYFDPSQDTGFWKSTYALASPLVQPPPYGNPVDNYHPFMESIYGRPMDAAAEVQQRLAFPMLSFAVAYKASNILVRRNNALGGKAASLVSEAMGGTPGKIRKARQFQGIFSAMGDQAGQGFAEGTFNFARRFSQAGILGNTSGAIAARTAVGEGLGIVTGAATGFALPYMLGEGIERAVDKTVFEPYIANRKVGRDLRNNFAHVPFGNPEYGNGVTGLGLGFEKSQKIAGEITKSGINDWMFTPQDMAEISDLSARSGLLDNVQADQISSRVSDIAKQVKLVMRVGGIIKKSEIFEVLQKLQNAGASMENGAAGNVYSTIGAFSSVAGVSTQRMMNTVGQQGQYMFQANSLVPYLGQVGAAKSFASFASAYRSGLISPALLASMGGTEGATQSAMGGQIAGENTIYNSLVLANRYLVGNKNVQGGVAGQLATSGREFAKDPIKWSGALGMYGPMMQSMDQMENGPMGLQRQVLDMAKSASPWEIHKDGKIDAEVAYQYMTQGIGMTHDQALANLKQWQSFSDPKTRNIMLNGLRSNMIQQSLQYADQEGLRYGPLTTPWRAVKKFGMGLQGGVSDFWSGMMERTGRGMDNLERAYHGFMYGHNETSKVSDFDSLADFDRVAPQTPIDKINTSNLIDKDQFAVSIGQGINKLTSILGLGDTIGKMGSRKVGKYSDLGLAISSINYGATSGDDKNAAAIIHELKTGKGSKESMDKISSYLEVMASQGKLPSSYKKDLTDSKKFSELASQLYKEGVSSKSTSPLARIPGQESLGLLSETARHLYEATSDAKSTDGKSITSDQRASIIEAADQIMQFTKGGKDLTELGVDGKLQRQADYLRKYYGGLKTNADILNKARNLYGKGYDQRVLNQDEAKGEGDFNLEETVNKAIKDPKSYLTPGQLKAFNEASGNSEKQRSIVHKALMANTGTTDLQEQVKILPGSASLDDKQAMASIAKQFDSNAKYIHQVSSQNKIDFQTQLAMNSANKMEESISNFGVFVKQFGEIVTGMKSGNSSTTTPNDSQTRPADPGFFSMSTFNKVLHNITTLGGAPGGNERSGK